MASVTLTLSARTSKDTGKAEVLLRYRGQVQGEDAAGVGADQVPASLEDAADHSWRRKTPGIYAGVRCRIELYLI